MQYCGHITCQQTRGRAEEHHEHHIEIAENGFPLEQWLKAYERTGRMKLLPKEQCHEQRGYDDVDAYARRGHPVERLAVGYHINEHEQAGGYYEHLARMKLFPGYGARLTVDAEEHDDRQIWPRQKEHHEVVHILPVVMIGQQAVMTIESWPPPNTSG